MTSDRNNKESSPFHPPTTPPEQGVSSTSIHKQQHIHHQEDQIHHPQFQKDDTNLLKRSLLSSTNTNNNVTNNEKATTPPFLGSTTPRTSMSQLKLSELAQDLEKRDVEDLGVRELRDGYFDPIYNAPRKVTPVTPLNDEQRDEAKKKTTKFSLKTYLTDRYLEYLSNKIITIKFTLAYTIALILSVIPAVQRWFGPFVVFLPLSSLVLHPVHSIGVQLEITFQSIIGLALGLGWGSVTLWLSQVSEPVRNHPGGMLFGGFSLALIWMCYVKGALVRFYYLFLYAGFVLIFMLGGSVDLRDVADGKGVSWRVCWDIGIPSLFGILVSLIVSLVFFPLKGDENLMKNLFATTGAVKTLLQEISNDGDLDSQGTKITQLQKVMIGKTLELSETFREFLSFGKFSKYSDDNLKAIRNHLNFIVGPLRVIPTPLKIKWRDYEVENDVSVTNSNGISQSNSGIFTPIPRNATDSFYVKNEAQYLNVIDDYFNVALHQLLATMITSINTIETTLQSANNDSTKASNEALLTTTKQELKKRISKIDTTYRHFAKSPHFTRQLLNSPAIINIFLFLRYVRQAAVQIIGFVDLIKQIKEHELAKIRWYWPSYPLKRALRRLSRQCLQDQGSDAVYLYFETKVDVDDAFERIYNVNTSRQAKEDKDESTTDTDGDDGLDTNEKVQFIRAIDHKDFNLHSTSNPFRFKLWKLLKHYNTLETKYAVKSTGGLIFLLLPGWLFQSNAWFLQYHCFWSAILYYFLLSPKNSSTWKNLRLRSTSWICCCFAGWIANQPSTIAGRAVLICVLGTILGIVFSGMLFSGRVGHPRSSYIGLISFTVIALSGFIVAADESGRSEIWKFTWVDSLAILIGVISSVVMNWIVWPFYAKREIYVSVSSLLSHIGQSYQSISERYLYRDLNDDPTDLTLELANIREVRMSQSLKAVKELLKRTKTEMDIIEKFPYDAFQQLLSSCDTILEKVIEARMSGIYFTANHQDAKLQKLKAELITIRRDSVSSVIYILYVLANSFHSRTKIPKYLPSTISIRKKLFDLIGSMELSQSQLQQSYQSELTNELRNRLTKLRTNQAADEDKSYMKTYWTEVHGMSFSRAYTVIAEELERCVVLSKEILGEEDLLE